MLALREHFYNPKKKKINSFVVFEIAIPIIVVIVLFFNTEFSPLFSAVVVTETTLDIYVTLMVN